jgi:hypothetical protein
VELLGTHETEGLYTHGRLDRFHWELPLINTFLGYLECLPCGEVHGKI